MRIIIAGSRNATEREVREALNRCPWIGFASAVVSGTASGADEYGERWASEQGIAISHFSAEWKRYGKRAGPIRNRLMSENAEGLVAVWDGKSRGTFSMIELALKRGLRVFVFRTDNEAVDDRSPTGILADIWEAAEERAALKEYSGGLPRLRAEREAGSEIRRRLAGPESSG